jgi:hypothetical protein
MTQCDHRRINNSNGSWLWPGPRGLKIICQGYCWSRAIDLIPSPAGRLYEDREASAESEARSHSRRYRICFSVPVHVNTRRKHKLTPSDRKRDIGFLNYKI